MGTLIRYLFWGMLLFLGYRALKQVFVHPKRETEVKGKPKKSKLNIDESKIEDADFEELNDK